MALVIPPYGELTLEVLAAQPNDGHRYELIDGGMIVTPAPGTNHQLCVGRLHLMLHEQLPPELTVMLSPYDYNINEATMVEPDLLVALATDFGPINLQATPLLVIEVLSPSTRYLDLGAKRLAYAAAGVPNYWIVDPSVEAPVVTVLTLGPDGSYDTAAVVTGDEAWPDPVFGVMILPSRLVGPAVGPAPTWD